MAPGVNAPSGMARPAPSRILSNGDTMRVLVVTNLFFSGRGNWVVDQVRSLQGRGVGIDVIVFDPKETRLHYGLRIPDIVRAIRSGGYDLIHTHHTYTFLMVDIARALAGSPIPVVLTNHEPDILDHGRRVRTWHPTSRLRHWAALKRIAASRADVVIFVARKLADALRTNSRHAIIPVGVDLGKYRPMGQMDCRRRLGLSPESIVVLFPAAPTDKRKRIELAQATYERLRKADSRYVLLTGGGVPADVMPFYYNAADVVLQTSFAEASPTIVKEALACEIPVVSTDVGDTADLLRGLPPCAVGDDKPDVLADLVLAVRRQRLTRGRERLLSEGLSLEQVADRVVDVYRQVLNR